MTLRFELDHVVIATSDLEASMLEYERIGFEVRYGGEHPGNGTHNAIMRFGRDYLELIGVKDRQLAGKRDRGRELVGYVDAAGAGLMNFSLSVDGELEPQLASVPGTPPPISLSRHLPSGGEFAWSMIVPGGSNCRRVWPFFIRWHTPATERLALEPPGRHPNGADRLAGISIAGWSVEAVAGLYAAFGLDAPAAFVDDVSGAATRTIVLDSARIELVAPQDLDGGVWASMKSDGEGPHAAMIGTSSLRDTGRHLRRNNVPHRAMDDGILVAPEHAAGTRLIFVEARAPARGATWTQLAHRPAAPPA